MRTDAQDCLLTSVCAHTHKEKRADREKVSILYTYRKGERRRRERRKGGRERRGEDRRRGEQREKERRGKSRETETKNPSK